MLNVFISVLGLGLRSLLIEIEVRILSGVNGVHVVHVVHVIHVHQGLLMLHDITIEVLHRWIIHYIIYN